MPLSALLVPEGPGDYELIPSDFGPCSLREAPRQGSRLKVTLECLPRERCSSFVMGCSLRCCSRVYNKMAVQRTLVCIIEWKVDGIFEALVIVVKLEEDEFGKCLQHRSRNEINQPLF